MTCLTGEDFILSLAAALVIDGAEIDIDAHLRDDLDLDSLGMFEVVVFLESLGVPVEVEDLVALERVRDAYDLYLLRTDIR